MRRVVWAVLFFLLIVFAPEFFLLRASQDAGAARLESYLPREAQGWKAEAKDDLYDPQTIFDYIDGAGEVYRAYNFKQLLSRRYKKEGRPDIIADFFEMSTSSDAFGVFTHDLAGEDPGIGQDGTYQGGLLSFWKDRFFVSIYAEKETEEAKSAVYALGKAVASAIRGEGPRPALLDLLPADFADKKIVHYLHDHLTLNYLFFVHQDNILGLDPTTEVVLAKPGAKGRKGVLLLVSYPEATRAAKGYKNFMKITMPGAEERGGTQTEDKKWTAAIVRNHVVAIVFGAPSAEAAKDILAKVEGKIK